MQKRIAINVDEEEYRLLRSKLALQGKAFSEWMREQISSSLASGPAVVLVPNTPEPKPPKQPSDPVEAAVKALNKLPKRVDDNPFRCLKCGRVMVGGKCQTCGKKKS